MIRNFFGFVNPCFMTKSTICLEQKGRCTHMTDILAPDDPALQSMADLFKVFGDPTRVRILFALFQQEACVQEIANRLGMTQSAISHQLRILKQARLVSSRREGKSIFYALADDHIYTIFRQALNILQNNQPFNTNGFVRFAEKKFFAFHGKPLAFHKGICYNKSVQDFPV